MKNCEMCDLLKLQQQQQQQQQRQDNCMKTSAAQLIKSLRLNTKPLCQHQQLQQQTQTQAAQQQRCSSVGSTGSACDTISSLSGSALSPTANNNSNACNIHQHGLLLHNHVGGLKSAHSSSCLLPNSAAALSNALTSAAAVAMPSYSSMSGAPLSAQQAANATLPTTSATSILPATAALGGLGAAAMAANLAESFTLLHQQAHQHFRDILYAAHLLGRGKEN